jgi:hypothetical protein
MTGTPETPETPEVVPAAPATPTEPAAPTPIPSQTTPTPSLPPVEAGEPAPPGGARPVGARAVPVRWAIAGAATIGLAALALGAFMVLNQAHAGTASGAWVPADVVGYAELSSQLTPDQQSRVSALLKHFPGFEDQARLSEKIDETFQTVLQRAGIDYTAQVKPWLGSSVAIAGRAPQSGATGKEQQGVVLVASTDDAAASRFVQTLADKATSQGDTVATQSYRDVPVTTITPKAGDAARPARALAVVAGRLVGGDPDLVHAVIDVRKAGAASLDSRSAFHDAIASLPADRVGAFWVDVAALATTARDQLQTVAPAAGLLTFSPDSALLGSVRVQDDGPIVEMVGRGSIAGLALLQPSPGATSPHAGRLAGSAPASTVVFVEAHDVGATIRSSLDAAKLANPSGPNPVDELNKSLAILGTTAEELSGAIGDAAVVSTLDGKQPGGGIVVEVKDQALAQRLLRQIEGLAALGGLGQIASHDYKGVTIRTVTLSAGSVPGAGGLPAGVAPSYALDGEVLVLASSDAVVEAVVDARHGGSNLASDGDFSAVIQHVGGDGLTTTFVDLKALIDAFAPTTLSAEERAFLTPLQALGASVHAAGEREWLGSSRLFVLVR